MTKTVWTESAFPTEFSMPWNQPAHQHVGGKSRNTLQKQGGTESELTLRVTPPFPDTAKHVHPVLMPCTLLLCPRSLPRQGAEHVQLPTTSRYRWERTMSLPALTNFVFWSMQRFAAYFESSHKLFSLNGTKGQILVIQVMLWTEAGIEPKGPQPLDPTSTQALPALEGPKNPPPVSL